jgi:hypothetical protein
MVYRALILWSDEVRSCQVYEAMLGSRNARLTLMLFWCSVELSGDSLCREWRSPLGTIGLVAFMASLPWLMTLSTESWSTPD